MSLSGRSAGAERGQVAAAGLDLGLIALGAVVLMLPSLRDGPPFGHDYPFHFNYMAAFTDQMAAGEVYPRWLADLWHGAGGPDLFFYPPLVYWVGGIFRLFLCPSCGTDGVLLLSGLFWLALFGAGIRALSLRYFDRPAALAGAILGMALPFHLGADWSDRFALAQFAAAAFIPWHMAAVLDCLEGRRAAGLRLALLSALILLCHLLTALMLAVVYPVLLAVLGRLGDWRSLGRLCLAGAVGLGLSAVYWYPATTLLDSVNTSYLDKAFFDPIAWLFWPAGLVLRDPFFFWLWPPFFALCVASLILVAAQREADQQARRIIAALVCLTIVLLTPLAWPLFEFTPVRKIQFPWRFLVISDVGFALAIALAAQAVGQYRQSPMRSVLGVAGLVLVGVILFTQYPGFRDSRNIHRSAAQALIDASAGGRGWLPVEASDAVKQDTRTEGLTQAKWIADMPLVRLVPERPESDAELVSKAPRRLVLEIDVPEPTRVVFRRTYWRFTELSEEARRTPVPLQPTHHFPLTVAQVPAGRGRYVLELPMLAEERTGLFLSIISLLFAAGWLARAAYSGGRREIGAD